MESQSVFQAETQAKKIVYRICLQGQVHIAPAPDGVPTVAQAHQDPAAHDDEAVDRGVLEAGVPVEEEAQHDGRADQGGGLDVVQG